MIQSKRHNPPTVAQIPPAFQSIYSHAVETAPGARVVTLSGQVGVAPDGTVQPDFESQCMQAMANVEALLVAANAGLSDVIKLTYYLTRTTDLPALTRLRQQRWASAAPPAVTTLVVAALARPEFLIEIDVIAAA